MLLILHVDLLLSWVNQDGVAANIVGRGIISSGLDVANGHPEALSGLWSINCRWLVAVLLQLIFIVRVGSGTLTLDYSLRFAAGGIPCDIASLILAARTNRNDNRPQGLVISASIGLFIWLALVSLH